MKILKKILLAACIIFGNHGFAQQDSINITKIISSIDTNYSFDGEWKILNTSINNNYIIIGNKITNKSKKTSNTLFLNLYFIPTNSSLDFPKKVNKNVILGKLEGYGTSFNNVLINFNDSHIKNFKKDNYLPLIVLKEQETNKILNYIILNDKISLDDNKILINNKPIEDKITTESNAIILDTKPSQENIDKESSAIILDTKPSQENIDKESNAIILDTKPSQENIDKEIFDPKLFDDYTTVQSSLDLENVNSKLKFQGIWQLSVDLKNLLINISGQNNRIVNSNSKATNDLKLLIYFSKEDISLKENIKDSKSIIGYELANIDLPPINGHFMIKDPEYKTNITKLLPSGEYYITLAIVEKNDEGEYIIRSLNSLGDKYIWK